MYYIYFVQEGQDGPIKIGVAKQPADRVRQLQGANSRPLILRGVKTGFVKDERALHKKLDAFRIRGEWFSPEPEVLAEIPTQSQTVNLLALE